MSSINTTPIHGRPKGAPRLLFFSTSQVAYNFPSWWRLAKITVQDGGYSSTSSSGSASNGGNGGDAGFSMVDISPGQPLSIIVGSGGIGGGAGTNLPSAAGGLSSVASAGKTLISSATATVKIKGGVAVNGNATLGASSFLSNESGSGVGNPNGGGAGYSSAGAAANQGGVGCVIFEYMEA